MSISLFSFCLTFPSTSIILFRGPLVYPSIYGYIRQSKIEPSLRQYFQNRVCYVVFGLPSSQRNFPIQCTVSVFWVAVIMSRYPCSSSAFPVSCFSVCLDFVLFGLCVYSVIYFGMGFIRLWFNWLSMFLCQGCQF